MAKQKVVTRIFHDPSLPPSVSQRAWGSAAIMGAFGFLFVSVFILFMLWRPLPFMPLPGMSLGEHLSSWLAVLVNSFFPGFFVKSVLAYQTYLADLSASGMSYTLYCRLFLAVAPGAAAAAMLFKMKMRPTNGLIHSDGRQLEDDAMTGVQKENARLAPAIKKMGGDLYVHPDIQYTMEQYSRQMIIFGAIGGGKTTIVMFLLHQIFKLDQKALIYDNKGEMAAQFPQASLLAPWQKGSLSWAISRDVRTRADAQLFAMQVIPDSGDNPMWSNAARQVLTGLIISLQQTKGIQWGWKDLANVIAVSAEDLLPLIEQFNPEAITIAESEGATTAGVLISMRAGLSWITDIAEAWGHAAPEDGISFIEWIFDDDCKEHRQIMLQGNGRFEQMMRGYVSSIISLMVSHINSPAFKRSRTRRLWLILDEFIQMGKLNNIMTAVEIGRSKGIRSVFGVQSVEQISELYGDKKCASLLSMIGTKIVCQVSPGETSKKIVEMIGSKEVERVNLSVGAQAGGTSSTTTINRDKVDVIHESRLSTDLGNRPELGAIVALLINIDSPSVLMLPWPHDKTPEARDSYIEADWVSGSVSRDAPPMTPPSAPGALVQTGLDQEQGVEPDELFQALPASPVVAELPGAAMARAQQRMIQERAAAGADAIALAFSKRGLNDSHPSATSNIKRPQAEAARQGASDNNGDEGQGGAAQVGLALDQRERSFGDALMGAARVAAAAAALAATGGGARRGFERQGAEDAKGERDFGIHERSQSAFQAAERAEHQDLDNQLSALPPPEQPEVDAMDMGHMMETAESLAHGAGFSPDASGVIGLAAMLPAAMDAVNTPTPQSKEEKKLALAQRREKLMQSQPESETPL